METFVSGLCFAKDFLFKSYYVVWKHDMSDEEIEAISEFKSYYVVWKLCID